MSQERILDPYFGEQPTCKQLIFQGKSRALFCLFLCVFNLCCPLTPLSKTILIIISIFFHVSLWLLDKTKDTNEGASLVVQWLRICLPMQGTWVWALVREDPTCGGATKPVRHNYWACALEPVSHNYWAHVPQLLSLLSRARALQQEKPPQWEARAPQWRAAPALRN